MKTVCIITPDKPTVDMFETAGWDVWSGADIGKILFTPDLICFTGGADVSPYLYGEENISSHCDPVRDEYEKQVYESFVGKVPMVGICRGGQFLNVMNGGKMEQHITGHRMGHQKIHGFLEGGGSFVMIEDVHEDHHQGMIPRGQDKIEPVHTSDEGVRVLGIAGDDTPEIIWYPDTKCLCFQPHPEWGHEPTKELFFKLIKEYIE